MAADRLRTLIPGSGHLVHMPAHIYARVGRWHDAVIANQTAIAADNDYLATCGPNAKGVYPLGYVPHNPHFLWFAASMEGSSKDRAGCRAPDCATSQPAGSDATAGFRRSAALLDDALVRQRPLRALGRDPGGTESGAGPALRHGDLELRTGDGGDPAGSDGRRKYPLRRTVEAGRRSDHADPDGLGPLSAGTCSTTSRSAR